MIIKSMARKSPSFGQLIHYFDKGQRQGDIGQFSQNVFASLNDRQAVRREFEDNHAYLSKRSNGNSLYHEVIVLEQGINLAPDQADKLLHAIAKRYCSLRSPHQLVYGRIHDDRDHRHIHLMISSNSIKSDRRVRLTKAKFADIQKQVEREVLQRYPELNLTPIYTRNKADRLKIKQREGEMERRTGKPSKKRAMRETLERHLKAANSRKDLDERLQQYGLKLYQRGKQLGLEPVGEGRRFRLKTLGMEQAYQEAEQRFTQVKIQERALAQKTAPAPEKSTSPKAKQKPAPAQDQRAEELLRSRQRSNEFAEKHLEDFERDR